MVSEAPDENQYKFALQLPKQDFYSFELCMVDKVHAVKPVDNNNEVEAFLVSGRRGLLA